MQVMGGIGGSIAVVLAMSLSLFVPFASSAEPVGYRQLVLEGAPVRWRQPSDGSPLTIAFAIATQPLTFNGGRGRCGAIGGPAAMMQRSGLQPSEFTAAVASALDMWQRAANIKFVEAIAPDGADLIFGAQQVERGIAFADLELDDRSLDPVRYIRSAAICLNPAERWKRGYDGELASRDLTHVIAHEIGHALGLDHPSARGHLMAFKYAETRTGLSDGDRLGVSVLYGSPRPTSAESGKIRAIR